MVLSLSITAFATENEGSITITNATIEETYELYKIFDASISKDADGNTNAVSYSIETDNQFFAALFGADGTTDNTYFVYNVNTGSVTKKEGVNDSAHGFGAERNGKMSGEVADFTSFSFHAVKNLTTGEGGAVCWRDIDGVDNEWIYKQYMLASLHGQTKDALAKTQIGAWEYDIVYPAYKCNMTDYAAAIGLVQLDRYEGLLSRRREIIEMYNAALLPLGVKVLPHYTDNAASSGHLYIMEIPGINAEKRNQLIISLAERGITSNVHYKPLPLLSAYKNLGFDINDYPRAYSHYEREITLPLHTLLSDDDVKYITDTLVELLTK